MWRSVVVNYHMWRVGRDKNPKQWPDPKHMKDDVEQMKVNFDFIEETQQF